MKKTIAVLFLVSMLFSTTIFAEPLYDYRLGQFTVDVGWWSGISEVAISAIPNKGGLNYAVSNAGNISGYVQEIDLLFKVADSIPFLRATGEVLHRRLTEHHGCRCQQCLY